MVDQMEKSYSIQEIVQASGVPRRTVRYYVQRGLLPPPEGAGRGHFYRPEHLDRLLMIKDLQGRGLSLEEIRARLDRGGDADALAHEPVPEMELTTRIHLAPGVELLVSRSARPLTPSQLRALAAAARQIVAEGRST